jgi:hypothetical protein
MFLDVYTSMCAGDGARQGLVATGRIGKGYGSRNTMSCHVFTILYMRRPKCNRH